MEGSPAASTSTSAPRAEGFQYAFRAEKELGFVASAHDWTAIEEWQRPEGPTRTACYSPDGRIYAIAANSGVYIYDVSSQPSISLVKRIPVKTAIEIALSPKGSYVSTWSRPIKLDDGAQHKNVQVFSTAPPSEQVSFGGTREDDAATQELLAFTQKAQDAWKLQFAEDESSALRSIQNEVQVLDPAQNFAVVDRLRLEGLANFALGPGRNPSVAVFVPERKGMPASVAIHSLATLNVPSIRKSFYKADRGQMKWNSSGTSLLFLSSTDHDKTGKSYYGETNLYLMTPALQYEARVTLDKEGHIGDFTWNPANGGKEFAVSYGFMPAKTMLFDTRLNVLHDFGAAPRNFVSFNPQGRLLCIAGFGNLAGHVDIWDRSTLKKVATFQASNCTECTWSPDGRLLMCATLSPRLRVDNGAKIYHWSGQLLHADLRPELYQAVWQPIPSSNFVFPRALSPAPPPSTAVQLLNAQKAASSGQDGTASPKPVAVGAYRPPNLRGRETPSIFKREDEGGPSSSGLSSATNGSGARHGIPGLTGSSQQTNGGGNSSNNRRQRNVPGAAPAADRSRGQDGKQGQQKKGGNRENRGDRTPRQNGSHATAEVASSPAAAAAGVEQSGAGFGQQPDLSSATLDPSAVAGGANGSALSPEDKKRRALQKKLGAIEALKAKRDAGEKLEKTQEKKIEAEAEVRAELSQLSVS